MKLKITPPEDCVKLLEAYANRFELSVEEACVKLLSAVASAHLIRGQLRFLGSDWQIAGVDVTQQLTGTSKNRQAAVEVHLTPNDLALLERQETLESGFAGVYATGTGKWRASFAIEGRRTQGPNRLTPEAAAWDRYRALKNASRQAAVAKLKKNMTPMEHTLAWLRQQYPTWSTEQLQKEADELHALVQP